jgi:hypothetical protein
MKQLNALIFCILTLPLLFFAFIPVQPIEEDPLNLLYSEQAIKRLKKEIELKNANFDAGVNNEALISLPQGIAAHLFVEGVNVTRVKKLVEANADWERVEEILGSKEKTDSVYFVKFKTSEGVDFYPLELSQYSRGPIRSQDPHEYSADLTGKWLISYQPQTKYNKETLEALFIRHDVASKNLPLSAITCIRYADHLIDTNTTIFTKAARNNAEMFDYGKNPVVEKLMRLTHDFPGKPEWSNDNDEKSYEKYHITYNAWEKARRNFVEEKLSKTNEFRTLLNEAYQEVTKNDTAKHHFMDELEIYVEKYISASAALDLKRKRIVIGGCSMDDRPIQHAANIARLAGESCCMEIFMRSHLNILYDRFDRRSDGNYAEPGRETYARELEVIGTRLEYLIPGTLLTARNLSENHYRGQVHRAGRAMAELESRKKVYEEVERLIQNPNLDVYNRILLIFLAKSYNSYLVESKHTLEAKQNLLNLKKSLDAFPDYLKKPLVQSIASIGKPKKD